MGFDIHGFQFVRYAATKKPLGRVATIGRQNLHVSEKKLRRFLDLPSSYSHQDYCEDVLIGCLGATSVASFDNSNYENATFISDMNKPLTSHFGEFDTVIDAGTSEHVYNAPQALRNISDLCVEGGQILHILPANNFCGHGFWQFSPELFLSLYSEANGYADTEIFIAELRRENIWYEVLKPRPGKRVNIYSLGRVYVLCRTRKVRQPRHDNIQQSDYVHTWSHSAPSAQNGWVARLKSRVKSASNSALKRRAYALYDVYRICLAERPSILNRNLRRHRVSALIADQAANAARAAKNELPKT